MNDQPPISRFQMTCLVIGQGLFALTTFFWTADGRYTPSGATLMFFSMLFWAMGFMGLFGLFKERFPRYSRFGLLYALYGVFGGVVFALEGLFEAALHLEKIGVSASEAFPAQMNLVMFWSGPAFPLSLLILGVFAALKKCLPRWAALLLALGGVGFPLGRILRMPWVAHATDLVLLVATIWIASSLFPGQPGKKISNP